MVIILQFIMSSNTNELLLKHDVMGLVSRHPFFSLDFCYVRVMCNLLLNLEDIFVVFPLFFCYNFRDVSRDVI